MKILKKMQKIVAFCALFSSASGDITLSSPEGNYTFPPYQSMTAIDKFLQYCAMYHQLLESSKNVLIDDSALVDQLSDTYLASTEQEFWQMFQAAHTFHMPVLAHALAQQYFNKIKPEWEQKKIDKKIFAPGFPLTLDARHTLRKHLFLLTRNKDLMSYKDLAGNTINLTLNLEEVTRVRKFWVEGGGRLRLCDLLLASIDGFKLPQSFQVVELDLSNNVLTKLPDSMGNVAIMKKLDLSNNKLTELPGWIFTIENLEMLVLNNNQLTHIPEKIAQLKKLWRLEINNNQLTEIPEALSKCPNLSILSLSNNKIKRVPDLALLPNLEKLYLNSNQITSVGASSIPKDLRILDLTNNNLTRVPSILRSVARLEIDAIVDFT